MDKGASPFTSTRKSLISKSIIIQNRVNHQIKSSQVRLIGEDGAQLGVVSLSEALKLAQEKGLDLIEVAAKANPPVCRIADFGKFHYQKEKQARAQKVSQKRTELKAIRIGIATAKHDLELKYNQAKKFLDRGHKVRIEIILRGREKAFAYLAKQRIEEFRDLLGENTIIDQPITKQPRGFAMIIRK